jgi:hypothetical protein
VKDEGKTSARLSLAFAMVMLAGEVMNSAR